MNKQDIIVQDKYNNCLKLNRSTVLEQLKRDRKQYRNCYSFKCSKKQFDKEEITGICFAEQIIICPASRVWKYSFIIMYV